MSENNNETDQEKLNAILEGDAENQSEGQTEATEKHIEELKSKLEQEQKKLNRMYKTGSTQLLIILL